MEQEPHPKNKEIFYKIDTVLAMETTIEDGVARAVFRGWLSAADGEDCIRAYHEKVTAELPVDTQPL